MVWRMLTAKFRTKPDVLLIGECRCGTTTLAALLRSHLRFNGPFTPWIHPLANEKESFFFSGHYWGIVRPNLYRLCFPLEIVCKFQAYFGRRRLNFDGCASYLSSPWVPRLVKQCVPECVIIVCVREPISQHISWWNLEQGSMQWAESLGLGRVYHGAPQRIDYPPTTLRQSVELSQDPRVAAMWSKAENLIIGENFDGRLPKWAMPFPNGQLSAFDRMGRFADNIERWQRYYGPDCFVFVELDELSKEPQGVLNRIAAACGRIVNVEPKVLQILGGAAPRLNKSPEASSADFLDANLVRKLAECYRPHNERLFRLIGRDLGWHNDPRYPYYM